MTSRTHCCPWISGDPDRRTGPRFYLQPLDRLLRGLARDPRRSDDAVTGPHLRDTVELGTGRSPPRAQAAASGEHLAADASLLRCFQFMNAVKRSAHRFPGGCLAGIGSGLSISGCAKEGVRRRGAKAASWPFQLAFILMQLEPSPTPSCRCAAPRTGASRVAVLPDRWRQDRGLPGLGCSPFAIRRRQGPSDSTDGYWMAAATAYGADALHPAVAHRPAVPARARTGARRPIRSRR